MAEKSLNLLQRYPIVPALFFILFAWAILHFITPLKPSLPTPKSMDTSPTILQNDSKSKVDWQLRISKDYIYFLENPQAVWETYKYQIKETPIEIFEGVSTTRKQHIKLFLLPKRKNSKRQEVIIEQEQGKYFYGTLVRTDSLAKE